MRLFPFQAVPPPPLPPQAPSGGPNLSEWALRHSSLVLFLMLACLLAGAYAYRHLGQKEDPDFTFRAMLVQSYWPGARAEDVEQQLTDRLERKLQDLNEFAYIRSYSKAGESQLLLTLREDIHPERVPQMWYQVRKRLGDIRHTLPAGVQGPFFNDEFGDTFGNLYALTGEGFSPAELKKYADAIRAELVRVPHVNKVELLGEQPERIYVELDTAKLTTLGIAPGQILQALAAANQVEASGVVESGPARIPLRLSGAFTTVDDIRQLSLHAAGRSIRLGDIAEITRAAANPPSVKMRFNGQEALGLAISLREGGDVLRLGEQLAGVLKRVRAELPAGMEIHTVADQPAVVRASVREFLLSLAEAVAIVLAVSFLSLGLRAGLVVALSIPLVLAMTFMAMYLAGIELQRVSLGALIIALGLLVDDAIIAVEMMALKLEQGWDRLAAATFAYRSTAFPMLTGTLITAAGFLPVGLARSVVGEYTGSIFQVVGIALLLSWLAAVVFTPWLGYWLLPGTAEEKAPGSPNASDRLNASLNAKPKSHTQDYRQGFYRHLRRWVSWSLQHRGRVILATLLVFLLALGLFRFVPKQFFPSSNRPELLVEMWLPQSAGYPATEAALIAFEARLQGNDDIVALTSYVGNGSPRFYLPLDQQLPNLNFAQIMVMPRSLEARERVRARINTLFEQDFPQVRGRVYRLENGPPIGYPVQFRVYGPDSQRIRQIAEQVAAVMRQSPHTRSVHTDWSEPIRVMRVEIDADKAQALGLSRQQVAAALQTGVSGQTATVLREHDRTIDIVLRLPASERQQPDRLPALRIPLPGGGSVPLAQLATLRLDSEESIIWRRNRTPTVAVRADVEGAQAPDVSARLWQDIQPIAAALPLGYGIETGGAQEASATGSASILSVMPLMALVIMTLLMWQLNSLSKMLLVLLTAPLGMIGACIILLGFQVPFGFVAQLGVIALAGMIMRNAVILVDQIDQDVAQGADLWQAIIESTVRRARPILLTAAACILAMVPLTRSIFWGPMAWAIMGGLLVATLLTLLFLPALYAAWFRVRAPTGLT